MDQQCTQHWKDLCRVDSSDSLVFSNLNHEICICLTYCKIVSKRRGRKSQAPQETPKPRPCKLTNSVSWLPASLALTWLGGFSSPRDKGYNIFRVGQSQRITIDHPKTIHNRSLAHHEEAKTNIPKRTSNLNLFG